MLKLSATKKEIVVGLYFFSLYLAIKLIILLHF